MGKGKVAYGPQDIQGLDYSRDLGDAGSFPYTRGIYPDMHRGRLWSRREITGCSTPRLTDERLKFLLREGETAINIICDQPTQVCLDPDHPWAEGSVGKAGVPICTMLDLWTIMDGILLNEVNTMLTAITLVAFAAYLLLADKQGIPYSELRVTSAATPPVLGPPVCMYGGRQWHTENSRRSLMEFIHKLEFIIKHCPKVYPSNFNAYVIRETGVGAAPQASPLRPYP